MGSITTHPQVRAALYARVSCDKQTQAQQRLHTLNDQIAAVAAQQSRQQDLQLVIAQVETFAKLLEGSLEQADWSTKRQVIRTLVKQIEIGSETVKVVYRIDSFPFAKAPERGISQHCWRAGTLALRPDHAFRRSCVPARPLSEPRLGFPGRSSRCQPKPATNRNIGRNRYNVPR